MGPKCEFIRGDEWGESGRDRGGGNERGESGARSGRGVVGSSWVAATGRSGGRFGWTVDSEEEQDGEEREKG